MSDDYKAAFRAAQAQRGLAAKPTKQQLKALKAKQGSAGSATAPKQVQFQAAPAGKPASAAGLPADFFDSKGLPTPQQQQQSAAALKSPPQQPKTHQQQQQQKQPGQQLAGMKRPAAAVAASTADAAGVKAASGGTDVAADTAVPKGFFDNKAADNSARGIKMPTKQAKEAAFAEFAASLDDQLKQQEVQEDEEAVEAALEREEREALEQQMRLERTAQLKALKNTSGGKDQLEIDAAIAAAVPAASKKRRVVDVLQEVLGGISDGDTEEADGEEDGLLDWRAKAV